MSGDRGADMESLGAEIRSWKTSDVPEIARIEKLCFSEPWSEQSLLESFENQNFSCLVCEREGKVAGYLDYVTAAGEAGIANLAVSPEFRRTGVAGTLLQAFLSLLKSEGCSGATLEVRPSNLAAKSLYAGFGFVREGLRKRFYSDGEDAEIWWLRF